MPKAEINNSNLEIRLEDKLLSIRKIGFLADYVAGELLEALGQTNKAKRTYEQDEALLISIVKKYIEDETDAELLLAAFGLLDGYKAIPQIQERRAKYYANGFPKGTYKNPQSTFQKREGNSIKWLVKCILREKDLAAVIQTAPGVLALPVPKYPAKNKKADVSSFSVPYVLTPNAPRWDNAQILGRDRYVADLCEKLQIGRPHIQLTGMGGIGKTEILNKIYVNFSDTHVDHGFDHIGLLFYDGSLDGNLAQQLACPDDNGADGAWTYLRSLCEKASVLLLIDDIRSKQNKQPVDDSFAKLFSLKATVLLASRTPLKGFLHQPVNALPIEECMRIFETQRRTDKNAPAPTLLAKDRKALEEVIKGLAGCNTLIVSRFGAMARDYNWNIDKLTHRLQERKFDIVKGIDDEEKLQEEINKLYSLADIQSAAEKNALEAFALFPAIPLDMDICIEWLQEDTETDEDNCRLLLNKLCKHTWLTLHINDDGSVSCSMHQMVRAAVRAQLSIEIKPHFSLIKNLNDAIVRGKKSEKLSEMREFIPFAERISEFFYLIEDIQVAYLMYALGGIYRDIVYYSQALKWLERSLEIIERVKGSVSSDAAAVRHSIARLFYEQGDYAKALAGFEAVLEIDRKTQKTDDKNTASTYNSIAFIYESQENYAEALKYLKKALAITEKERGTEDFMTAGIYNNIGALFAAQDKYTEALEWFQKALQISEKGLGPDHPDTAMKYVNIAKIHDDMGEYDMALELLQKALPTYEAEWGEDHPSTATVYQSVAHVYSSTGNYGTALEWQARALKIQEEKLGSDHPSVAKTLADIGAIYFNVDDYRKALEFYCEAKEIFEAQFGKEHPATQLVMENVLITANKIGLIPKEGAEEA